MLVDRVRGGGAHGVGASRVDRDHGIVDTAPAGQERRSIQVLRQLRFVQQRGWQVDQGAAPRRAGQAHPARADRLGPGAGVRREDARAHGAGGAHAAVVAGADAVALAGMDAPHRGIGGQAHLPEQLAWLAQQPEQGAILAAGDGALVHHAAGRADHLVLHRLRGQGDGARVEDDAGLGQGGDHDRDLDRGRGADAGALRHCRAQRHGHARAPIGAVALGEQGERAEKIAPPAIGSGAQPGDAAQCRGRAAPARLAAVAGAGHHHLAIAAALQRRAGRLAQRQLQAQAARVVGDAAEQIEPPGRPGQPDRPGAVELAAQRASERIGERGQVIQPRIGAGDHAHAIPRSASSRRRRGAMSRCRAALA